MTTIQICDEVLKLPSANEAASEPVPAVEEEWGFEYLKRILPQIECISLTQQDLDNVVLKETLPPEVPA